MPNNDDKVYSIYTTFRNHIRQANLISSLRAIHAHVQHFQFNQPLPSYIRNTPFGYSTAYNFEQLLAHYHLYPWELETIAKELIIHGDPYGVRKTLEDWNYLCGAVNKLKELEDKISGIYVTTENVLGELARITHRQFVWETKPNITTLGRYWKIYSQPELASIVQNSLGIPVSSLYTIGLALLGLYQDKFALLYPPIIRLPNVQASDFDKFIAHFSIPMNELREKLIVEQQMNDRYVYAYNSLRAFPLVRTMYEGKDALICPMPGLLFRRLSEGLYYEVCNKSGFDKAYGQSFQKYVGRLAKEANSNLEILPEITYGQPEKKTSDWIICDDDTTLFVECKGKRLTMEAKSSLLDDTAITEQIGIMADAVVQAYKSIRDHQNNEYYIPRQSNSKVELPLVVTLEEWFLFGDKLTKILDTQVRARLSLYDISDTILTTNPYTVCSLDSYNLLVTTSKYHKIKKMLLEKWNDIDGRQWQLDVFLQHHYPLQLNTIETYSEETELEQSLVKQGLID